MKYLLVFGGTSAIAQAALRIIAGRGTSMFLVARDSEKLNSIADDLKIRGASQVKTFAADLSHRGHHNQIISAALDAYPELDTVIVAHGVLPNQSECENNTEAALSSIDVNYLSVVSLLTPLANHFAEKRRGVLAVISSVAGDRGRKSNYIYGSAKSGLNTYLAGLRNRLSETGVQVLTIKPGFVNTPMTSDVQERNILWAEPEEIAKGIVRAIDKRSDVVYLPKFWRAIMFILRSIPERFFKRLNL
ncbi:MAG: SDR family oxidoreductase [Pseudomonadota bacterium]|nr:SDR family oxidoreductase [Pseudomonadota bacterium]